MSNEDKRLAIMAELARRAEQSGAEVKFYRRLTPAIAVLLEEAGMDAVELTGLYHALLRYGAMVAYGTIGSPADLQVRTDTDVGAVAAAMWDKACRDAEALVERIKDSGNEVPKELVVKTQAAPSDPSKRPDLAPTNPMSKPERSNSLEELIGRINTMGTGGN